MRSCAEFLGRMAEIRAECERRGLFPVYHYSSPFLAPFITNCGFRLSVDSDANAGISFSTKGPASFGLGTHDYEKNLIVDVFGATCIKVVALTCAALLYILSHVRNLIINFELYRSILEDTSLTCVSSTVRRRVFWFKRRVDPMPR